MTDILSEKSKEKLLEDAAVALFGDTSLAYKKRTYYYLEDMAKRLVKKKDQENKEIDNILTEKLLDKMLEHTISAIAYFSESYKSRMYVEEKGKMSVLYFKRFIKEKVTERKDILNYIEYYFISHFVLERQEADDLIFFRNLRDFIVKYKMEVGI